MVDIPGEKRSMDETHTPLSKDVSKAPNYNKTASIGRLGSIKPEITIIETKEVDITLTPKLPPTAFGIRASELSGDEDYTLDDGLEQHAELLIAGGDYEPIYATVRGGTSEADLQSDQTWVGKGVANSDTLVFLPSPTHNQTSVSQQKEHTRAKSEDSFYDSHHPKHNIVGNKSTNLEEILQIPRQKSTTIPGSWPIFIGPEILGAEPPPAVFQQLNPTTVQTTDDQENEQQDITSVEGPRETRGAAGLVPSLHSELRLRSRSVGAPQRAKAFPLALFDTREGSYNERSAETVDSWFQDLTRNTHALLKPLQRNRMKRVKIAILDTGIDRQHQAFLDEASKARIKKTEDFLDPSGKGHDVCGHGTHCLGLLRKVAPEADIYVARVMKDFRGNPDPKTIVKAINRAACNGIDSEGIKNWNVDIISMSLGFRSWVPEIQNAIEDALKQPVLFFAAASNNGSRLRTAFPADMPGVFCVNAADGDGIPCGFNPPIQASSPNFSTVGENVRSSWIKWRNGNDGRETDEKVMSGTSVATPIAAGIAALVLEFAMQEDPSNPEIDMILKEQLFFLRRQVGMEQVLTAMSEKIREYNNIVPWNILKVKRTREKVAVDIERLMDSRFRND
ncbi:peptidase S8/S53 domain-containing protein [Tricladium varicosporioides]|nr:peptidase S8/S53 domain-containing protein [Hymenoscyphus varicosporioides]